MAGFIDILATMPLFRIAALLGVCVALSGCASPAGSATDPANTATPAGDPSPTAMSTPYSLSPRDTPSTASQGVEWPTGSEFAFTEDGLGPLVLGAAIPTSDPRGALSECGAVPGVPPNVAVGLLDDGTVVKISASAPLGDPGEIDVSTPQGVGLGASTDDVLAAYGADAEYREVTLQSTIGEKIEYRVDVDLGGSLLVLSFGERDAGDPAPSADSLAVKSMRLALPGYEDPPWYCA